MRTDLSQTTFLARKLRQHYIWRRILLERMTEPLHLNLISAGVWLFGSFRAKVAFDLVLRHHHACGILKAADQAKRLGIERLTLLEFGVAAGTGLMNMARVASEVTHCTGVAFDIYGFDTGQGMPPPRTFRDHPELFQAGDFVMDVASLRRSLPDNVHLVLGEVADTVPGFIEGLEVSAPVGFVSIDVDYYYSTKDALRVLIGEPEKYLPTTCIYLDDIEGESYNSYCGEQLAVHEFNQENELRKIEKNPFFNKSRIFQRAPWIDHMFTLHVLDHPTRATIHQARDRQGLVNPYLTAAGRP